MDFDSDATQIFPCPHCGASATQPGRTQPGMRPVPVYDLQKWHETAESVARTLTLIRESLASKPEDLDETVERIESEAWDLSRRIRHLSGEG